MSGDAIFRGPLGDVGQRVEALSQAVEASRGRLPDALLDPAADLVGRAAQRLTLSGEHTIIALAGATGSGKSSLFNRLTDLDLAGVGARRPTTSWALACAWGPDGAEDLLAWMGIPPRHQISRKGMLDMSEDRERLDGLVLLDLPDHDSTEVEHRVEMDRLIQYADAMVWVLDPQKYADAAIHDRYLRQLAGHRDVTIVVLNQIDRIDYTERARALEDVRRILDDEGLDGITLLGTSASRGDGVDELKRQLKLRIDAKRSSRDRLGSDVSAAAASLARAGGTAEIPGLTDVDRQYLETSLEAAAGVRQVVQAVRRATRRRGARLTGWPPLRWLVRRPKVSELSVGVQGAQAEVAIREFADTASVGLDGPWRDAVRAVSAGRAQATVPKLEAAVDGAGLVSLRSPLWWYVVNILQWVGILALLGGALWWAGVEFLPRFGQRLPAPAQILGYPMPIFAAASGLVAGVALALGSALANRVGAVRRARHIERVLRASIDAVAEAEIVTPVRTELDAYQRYRSGILRARG